MPFVSRRVAASRVQLAAVASPSEARTERGASERGDECERGDAEEDCRCSASPLSNGYSRRALSLSPLSFNRRQLCWGSPSLLNEEGELSRPVKGRRKSRDGGAVHHRRVCCCHQRSSSSGEHHRRHH
ncbi:hypothetical protein Ahy_A02g009886 [Arachis hypogaea]|uniref:Uncharacterized protein n=1 Tax=Arachis hypogaea TaxID=3818 RepID=A0A445EIG5_ARAHY|nr:hypothetical protein Ahy_A02g009886 [Arachis hypogaea]